MLEKGIMNYMAYHILQERFIKDRKLLVDRLENPHGLRENPHEVFRGIVSTDQNPDRLYHHYSLINQTRGSRSLDYKTLYRSKSASPTCKRMEFFEEPYYRPRSAASIATPRRRETYSTLSSYGYYLPTDYLVTPRGRALNWEMRENFTKELHPLTKQRLAILSQTTFVEKTVKPVRPDDKRPRSRCESRASSRSVDRVEYNGSPQQNEIDSILTDEDKNVLNHFINMCKKFDEAHVRKILETAYKLSFQKNQ